MFEDQIGSMILDHEVEQFHYLGMVELTENLGFFLELFERRFTNTHVDKDRQNKLFEHHFCVKVGIKGEIGETLSACS